jgi:hypothetical protein
MFCAGCGTGSTAPAITFDPCEPTQVAPLGATTDQVASIDGALAMWHALGVASLSRADNAPISIEFRDAPASMYGFYDPPTANIYINIRLMDAETRAIVIAHEIGHALGLAHVPLAERASVMNPGNLTVLPTAEDAAALVQLWGQCP